MKVHSSKKSVLSAVAAVALGIGIFYFLNLIPAVEGLGSKVKLPMFHGASTWSDLMILTVMGVAAVIALATSSRKAYGWEVGLRSVGLFMWFANSVMGYIAARSTWDFTGSKQSPFKLILGDPRLMAQVYLAIGALVLVLLIGLVLEKRSHKSIADLVYVGVMWVLMLDLFLDPVKRALHPDSPVLNSEELLIKLPFFGMVACIFALELLVGWIISRHSAPKAIEDSPVTE